jgi:hypothetical protein
MLYTGIAHTHLSGRVDTIDGEFICTGVRDGSVAVASTTGEVLNTSIVGVKGFEITFVLHASAVLGPTANGQTPFFHLPGGTLDIYIQNITPGLGAIQADPNLTVGDGTGGGGFMDGTQVAHLVDIGSPGSGNLDFIALDGNDDAVFSPDPALGGWALNGVLILSGLDNTFRTADDIDLLHQNGLVFAYTDSNFDSDLDNNGIIDSGPPSGWPFPLKGVTPPTDFFSSEDGSAAFVFVPEPAAIVVWSLLGASVLGLARVRRKQ